MIIKCETCNGEGKFHQESIGNNMILDEVTCSECQGTGQVEIIEQGPEILIPKKNVILDSQILSTLMSCGRLTDFRFNLHLQSLGGKSVSLEMGSIVHKFLETYYQSIINGIKKTDAVGFAETAARAYILSPEVQNSSNDDRAWALETCAQYLDYYKNDYWTPLEVEVTKGKVLYEDDEVRIMWKAKFDLISDTNQGIFPIDHKTMKQRRDTLTLNNQFKGQCILAGTRTMFVNKIGFQKSLKPDERFLRVMVNYTADSLIEWQSQILPYWVKVMLSYQEGEFWPPNYTHCENKYGFCQFKDVCEADRNVREEILGQNFVVGEPWDPENT